MTVKIKTVNVAVAVIQFEQQIFIAKRRADQHQGNRWEFPGGKIESNESTATALIRELSEETGITVANHQITPLLEIPFEYPDKAVYLHVCRVELTSQQAQAIHGAEGQQACWVPLDRLADYQFPDANQPIIDLLTRG